MNPLQVLAARCTACWQRLMGRDESTAPPLVSELYDQEPELAGLVDKFVQRYPEIMSEMTVAAARADWKMLGDQAHNLKGLGGGYGFPQVSQVAEQLEQAARDKNATQASALLYELERLAQRIHRGQREMVLLRRPRHG